MPSRIFRAALAAAVVAGAVTASACGVLTKNYEYEEEIYLRLDGTATVNVNASVASLVALHGVDLPVEPKRRVDRGRVRALFQAPGVEVAEVSLSRRHGRRFVHVSIDVSDIRQLHRVPMLSWSTYRFERRGDVLEYQQRVGASAARPVDAAGWTGQEFVLFKMHIPSEIPYHNSPSRETKRGNILEWDQPLVERLRGVPIDLQVRMEPESILYTTLILFGLTIVAAAITFGLVLWWLVRRGRESEELPAH